MIAVAVYLRMGWKIDGYIHRKGEYDHVMVVSPSGIIHKLKVEATSYQWISTDPVSKEYVLNGVSNNEIVALKMAIEYLNAGCVVEGVTESGRVGLQKGGIRSECAIGKSYVDPERNTLADKFHHDFGPLLTKTPSLFSEALKKFVSDKPLTMEEIAKLTGKKEILVGAPVILPKGETKGYHLTNIERGKFGEFSKIKEEFHECEDALKQNNVPMLFVELSDMLLAIDGFLKKHHPTVTLDHLMTHARATERAFDSGERRGK